MSGIFTDQGGCPLPHDSPHVTMAHGSGGRSTDDLIRRVFLRAFSNPLLDERHDAATFPAPTGRLAYTTDSYVVRPLFFPGGDIGSLAIHGTVNDLAMAGAKPLHLSASFILQEGLRFDALEAIVESMRRAALRSSVDVVCGDTKVIERRENDGLFVSMSGVGTIDHELDVRPARVKPGDAILLSGDVGRHGVAVLAARESLGFEGVLPSDSAPLHEPVAKLIDCGVDVHCLRDVTRGGLAAALVEIAAQADAAAEIDERLVLVAEPVRAACELLGLDPLHVACEGRFVAFVPEEHVERSIEILRDLDETREIRRIGFVHEGRGGEVTRVTPVGSRRRLLLPAGEPLPRIC